MKRLFTTFLLLGTMMLALAQAKLEVTTPSAVVCRGHFRIEFTANGQARDFRWELPDDGNFKLLYGPSTSSSTTIINGVMTRSMTYSYTLQPLKEGTFTLPAGTCTVDGKKVASRTSTVKVLPPDSEDVQSQQQQSRGRHDRGESQEQVKFNKDNLFLGLDLSKTSAYEGEAIVAVLKLYWRNTQVGDVINAKLPDFEGFTVQEMDNTGAQAQLEHVRGANYQAYPIARWLLFPNRKGEISISPASLTAIAQVVTTRRGGGFFDWPMEYVTNVEVPLTSAPRKVTIKDMPAGKPASFMGGVGDFKINTSLSSTQTKANNAISYTITIEGTGNLKYVKEPQPEFPADFEVYDPKVDQSFKPTSSGVSGKKVIEYTVIPHYGGTFTIPSLAFSYLDAKSGQYKTLNTESYTIEVEKDPNAREESSGTTVINMAERERLKELGSDIRYLHQLELRDLSKGNDTFFGSWAYWLFFIVPFVAFVVLAIVYRRQLKLNADVAGKRTRKANKVAGKRLKEASAALKAKDESKFYEAVHKAMLGYVSDKLRIPMSELNIDNVMEQLTQHHVSEEGVKACKEVLETCEFARYAPSHDEQAMDKLYSKAVETLDRLESEIKK